MKAFPEMNEGENVEPVSTCGCNTALVDTATICLQFKLTSGGWSPVYGLGVDGALGVIKMLQESLRDVAMEAS